MFGRRKRQSSISGSSNDEPLAATNSLNAALSRDPTIPKKQPLTKRLFSFSGGNKAEDQESSINEINRPRRRTVSTIVKEASKADSKSDSTAKTHIQESVSRSSSRIHFRKTQHVGGSPSSD